MPSRPDISIPVPNSLIDEIAKRVADELRLIIPPLLEGHLSAETKVDRATTSTPPPTFLRLKDLIGRLGVARSTIYRWIAEGRFPQPVQLGARTVAWRTVDILEWETHPGARSTRRAK